MRCRNSVFYARYDTELSREGLDALGLAQIQPAHVPRMDSIEHIAAMRQVGTAVADLNVRAEHFAACPG